jgi:tripartite ATP-independent transporter DctM subunit
MILVLILFAAFLIMGMPVTFAIGISGFVFFLQQPTLPLTIPVQLVLSATQNFTLLAIPSFILAGNLMNETGITSRLLKLSAVLTGHMYGWLGQVTTVLSALMGGVSGSAIADASMQARILGPDMTERGYARGYSAAIIGVTGLITIAIPPSIGMVLYGSIGEVSIGRLFAGGIAPGLLMTLFLMISVTITSRKKRYLPERDKPAPLKEIVPTFFSTIWAFLFPIILIVGLRGGLLIPSEAGAFASFYALAVGLIVYRELTWSKFMKAVKLSIIDNGVVIYLIAMSALVSYGITWEMIPQMLAGFLLGISENPMVIMMIIVAFLLFLGMFIDSTVMILLLTSILVPVITRVGIDPVHFGVVMIITCAIGLFTPPVGLGMYSVCSIMECTVGEYIKECVPFLGALVVLLVFLIVFPNIVLFIPNLIFGPA